VAGKTGTTNGTTNAWFIGVTPDWVAGVWVGFDQPRPILPDGTATGGRVAAPIWAEVMKRAPAVRTAWAVPDTSAVPPPVPPPVAPVLSTAAGVAPFRSDTSSADLSDSLVVQ